MNRSKIGAKLAIANLLGMSGFVALPVQATLINNALTSTISVSADAATPVQTGPSTNSTYVSNYDFMYGTNGSYSNASAWGNSYGTYRAGADGNGVFNSNGRFQREVQLTNNNGVATAYSLNFFVYYGSISASNNGASGSGFGSYDLSIRQNNSTTLFASGARVNADGTLALTGTQLNDAQFFGDSNGGYYSWGGTYVTLDLGTLADGASTSINFDLVSTAFGNFGTVTSGGYGGYGGYGGEYGGCYNEVSFAFLGDGYGGGCTITGSVYASLGDPGDFAENRGEPNTFTLNERVAAVPLPGTLPLLAFGLAGLACSRRYRVR